MAILDRPSKLLSSIAQSTLPLQKMQISHTTTSILFATTATTDHSFETPSRRRRSTGEEYKNKTRKFAGSLEEYQKTTLNGFSLRHEPVISNQLRSGQTVHRQSTRCPQSPGPRAFPPRLVHADPDTGHARFPSPPAHATQCCFQNSNEFGRYKRRTQWMGYTNIYPSDMLPPQPPYPASQQRLWPKVCSWLGSEDSIS